MDKNKLWMIGSALAMVLILVLGVLLGVQPQLAARASAVEQRQSVAASNANQAAVLAELEKEYAGLDGLKADLEPLRDSVPTSTEMPELVQALGVLADQSQVVLTGFTVSDAVPYAPVEVAVAADDGSGATTVEGTDSDAAAGLGAGVPPVTRSQITADNFVSLTVTVAVEGSYENTLEFVNGLQSGDRLVLVSGISTTAGATDEGEATSGNVTALITGLVYVLLPDEAAAPAPVD